MFSRCLALLALMMTVTGCRSAHDPYRAFWKMEDAREEGAVRWSYVCQNTDGDHQWDKEIGRLYKIPESADWVIDIEMGFKGEDRMGNIHDGGKLYYDVPPGTGLDDAKRKAEALVYWYGMDCGGGTR